VIAGISTVVVLYALIGDSKRLASVVIAQLGEEPKA
jgi:hypothetical protein